MACAQLPASSVRRETADQIAESKGWARKTIQTDRFVLISYSPKTQPTGDDVLSIYIEGDGVAWSASTLASPDPTPINPVGLRLALKHPSGAVAYLARPCQFVESTERRNCRSTEWTSGRFSQNVVDATHSAISHLKEAYGARHLNLIGYSGGAAIAALVTARRSDVATLITIAGNLDHITWTTMRKDFPLLRSLNPPDFWMPLSDVRQVHFSGSRDTVVATDVVRAFASRFPIQKRPNITIVDGFDHICCWVDQWPYLWSLVALD
jgi:hypothetical protein